MIKTAWEGKGLFHLTGYKTACNQGSRAGAWGMELEAETKETCRNIAYWFCAPCHAQLAFLAEDTGAVPSTHIVAQNHL